MNNLILMPWLVSPLGPFFIRKMGVGGLHVLFEEWKRVQEKVHDQMKNNAWTKTFHQNFWRKNEWEHISVNFWSTHSCVVYLEGIRMKRRTNVVGISRYINACMFVDCVVAVLCTFYSVHTHLLGNGTNSITKNSSIYFFGLLFSSSQPCLWTVPVVAVLCTLGPSTVYIRAMAQTR